jgi:hypothetical protein
MAALTDLKPEIVSNNSGVRGDLYGRQPNTRNGKLGYDLAIQLLGIIRKATDGKLKDSNDDLIRMNTADDIKGVLKMTDMPGTGTIVYDGVGVTPVKVRGMHLDDGYADNLAKGATDDGDNRLLYGFDGDDLRVRDNTIWSKGDDDNNVYEKATAADDKYDDAANTVQYGDAGEYKKSVVTLIKLGDGLKEVKNYLYLKNNEEPSQKYASFDWKANVADFSGEPTPENDLIRFMVELSLITIDAASNASLGSIFVKHIDALLKIIYNKVGAWTAKFYKTEIIGAGNVGVVAKIISFYIQLTSNKIDAMPSPVDLNKAISALHLRITDYEKQLGAIVRDVTKQQPIDLKKMGTAGDVDLSGLAGGRRRLPKGVQFVKKDGDMEVYTFGIKKRHR